MARRTTDGKFTGRSPGDGTGFSKIRTVEAHEVQTGPERCDQYNQSGGPKVISRPPQKKESY